MSLYLCKFTVALSRIRFVPILWHIRLTTYWV